MISFAFVDRAAVRPEDDPASPSDRIAMATLLLEAAIRRYDEAGEAWALARELYPNLAGARAPADVAESSERRAWLALLEQTEEDYDLAELALAGRIQAMFDMVSPPGRKADLDPASYFLPRAVRHLGMVYVLADDVNRYEPRCNFIATYRETMIVDI